MNTSESSDPHRGGRGSSNQRNYRGSSSRGHHTSSNTSSQSNNPNASSSRGDHGRGRGRGRVRGGRGGFMSPAKAERARLAREAINTTIPHILSHTPRAKTGVESAVKYNYSEIPVVTKSSGTYVPKISIVHSDTFDAARDIISRLRSQNPRDYESGKIRIGVLNMASNINPGGGVLNGSQAQEETLCRRSTLYPSLLQSHFHPLPAGSAIFTPDVLVFMTQSYEMLKPEDRFYIDVISMAAPKRPDLTPDKKRYAEQSSYEELISGVKGMMRLAKAKGVTHFVAGAFGCGAYGNPNALVAECFKRVICGRRFGSEGWEREEREVWSGVEEVVFAIYGEDRGKGNLATFGGAFRDVVKWQEGRVDGEGETSSAGAGAGETVGEASGSATLSTV
ncbi:uncharacterized protein DFL_002950 [Arthrobotrys flagrans]|uniref:Microbial-type PARG catalytic domain-containing protein n=1 Tax=Arthrobotrys flagrans TaxID=97331 RepID=A0A437ACB4_ARTFL|nr:hypothetical protein DFL_002950 [Arthrobotrys flagrans]